MVLHLSPVFLAEYFQHIFKELVSIPSLKPAMIYVLDTLQGMPLRDWGDDHQVNYKPYNQVYVKSKGQFTAVKTKTQQYA